MKKKLLVFALALLFIGIICLLVSFWYGVAIIGTEIIILTLFAVTLMLNEALKHTNWYKNIFIYTKQMCSNMGYRDYMVRNLEVVNVGSFPARFGFHYDDILGENWSTGNQGLDMDFEILKFRHSFIKRGGFVLIPLMPFSCFTCYLKDKPEYLDVKYYAKFASTLDPMQVGKMPSLYKASKWARFPFFYNPKSIRYLLFDEQLDSRLLISEMSLMRPQLEEDARHLVESWLAEFKLKSLSDSLREELIDGMKNTASVLKEMIDFLIERDLKPVLILMPMSNSLQCYFTKEVRKTFVYDFVDMLDVPKELFLDFSENLEFQNPQLYFNSLFLNLKGRKLFTKQVLKDLGLT